MIPALQPENLGAGVRSDAEVNTRRNVGEAAVAELVDGLTETEPGVTGASEQKVLVARIDCPGDAFGRRHHQILGKPGRRQTRRNELVQLRAGEVR